MAFCPRCGSKNDDAAKFCTSCGNSLLAASFQDHSKEQNYNESPVTAPPQESGYAPVDYGASYTGNYSAPSSAAEPAWSPEITKKAPGKGKLIGLISVIIVLVIALVSIVVGKLSGTGSEKNSSKPGDIVGYYTISHIDIGGEVLSKKDIEELGYDDWYIVFEDDGSGRMDLFGVGPEGFSYADGEIRIAINEKYSYEFDGTVLLDMGDDYLVGFSPSSGTPPEVTARPSMALPDSGGVIAETIELETIWYGTIEISKHNGAGYLENGVHEIWGSIGETEEGLIYFEMFESLDADIATLSMWIDLYDDYFVPVIGDEDAWYYYIYLDENDVEPLTVHLENGALSNTYQYEDEEEGESFTVSFTIYPFW